MLDLQGVCVVKRWLCGAVIILAIVIAFLIVGTIDYNTLVASCSGC